MVVVPNPDGSTENGINDVAQITFTQYTTVDNSDDIAKAIVAYHDNFDLREDLGSCFIAYEIFGL